MTTGEKIANAARGLDLSRGVIPIVAALTMLFMVAGVCLTAGAAFNDMRRDRDDSTRAVATLSADIKGIQEQITILTAKANNLQPEAWFLRFCYEAERANKDWRCPVISMRAELPPAPHR